MAKNKDSLVNKTDADLMEMVTVARESVRAERFKDTFARKASVIRQGKREVAQALTALNQRRSNVTVK
jgi:ribosomal protein L29